MGGLRRPGKGPFQSHAGSIEAEDGSVELLADDFSFNPTLVRLRRNADKPGFYEFFAFQSHAGSIEAFALPKLSSSPKSRFNPTLVRLRRLSSASAFRARL